LCFGFLLDTRRARKRDRTSRVLSEVSILVFVCCDYM
jgi:hypothetical protein